MSGGDDSEWGDLPRIVVGEDSIVVLESLDDISDSDNNWVERDVEVEDFEDLSEEDIEKFFDDEYGFGFERFDGEELRKKKGELEEGLGQVLDFKFQESRERNDFEEFYNEGKDGFYDALDYEEKSVGYDEGVKGDFIDFDERGKERSVLEMMGFEDKEAEERRERKSFSCFSG